MVLIQNFVTLKMNESLVCKWPCWSYLAKMEVAIKQSIWYFLQWHKTVVGSPILNACILYVQQQLARFLVPQQLFICSTYCMKGFSPLFAVAVRRPMVLCFALKTSVIHMKKSGQHVQQTRVLLTAYNLMNLIGRPNMPDHVAISSDLWTFPCQDLKMLTKWDLEGLICHLWRQGKIICEKMYPAGWLLQLLQALPNLAVKNRKEKTHLKVSALVMSLTQR
jgi:hypothetical protein